VESRREPLFKSVSRFVRFLPIRSLRFRRRSEAMAGQAPGCAGIRWDVVATEPRAAFAARTCRGYHLPPLQGFKWVRLKTRFAS
jgi:hypothetical protein